MRVLGLSTLTKRAADKCLLVFSRLMDVSVVGIVQLID